MNAKKLRDSILHSAIQGKLVHQNPKDEPASELLKRFTEEKQRMIKEGIIKKEKPLPPIKEEDIPFGIPDNWEWVRLGDLVSIFGRIGYRGYTKGDMVKKGEGAITISPSNITSGGKTNFDDCSYISWDKYEESPEIMIYERDIILVKTGSSYGKCAIVRELPEKATINPQLVVLKNILCDVDYLELILKSSLATNQYEQFVIGTSIPTFSQSKLSSLLLPLPPLEEQYRIVEKIKELMLYVDQYDQVYFELENLNEKFPKDMQKSILQYAMQGKLVEQDSNDEPAQQLIEKIRVEKEQLIKEKVIKKEKPLPPIIEEEIPFDIPSNWMWVRVKEISTFGNFETIKPELILEKEWVLDLEEIEKNTGKLLQTLFNADKKVKSNKYKFQTGDVLYGKLRPYLNKVIVAPNEGYCTTEIVPIRLLGNINTKYFQSVLMSPYFIRYANDCSYGVKMPRLGTNQLAEALIPLPPLNEQKRIVEAIEKLMLVKYKLNQ